MPTSGWLTTTEAARRLGVSSRTLLRWLVAGEVKGVSSPGGHWRISQETVTDMIERGRGTAGREPAGRTRRVVIIEDDPSFSESLERLVRAVHPRAEVFRATDGLQAGLLLGTRTPDVAFVDIELPALDGIEVIRRARALPELASTKFIVVSGHVTPERRTALSTLGGFAVVEKPVDPQELLRQLEEALATAAEDAHE